MILEIIRLTDNDNLKITNRIKCNIFRFMKDIIAMHKMSEALIVQKIYFLFLLKSNKRY